MLRELGLITPLNFGIMYCLDVLWKLILVRFELLLDSEDEFRAKIQTKVEGDVKKRFEALHFQQTNQNEYLRATLDKLKA